MAAGLCALLVASPVQAAEPVPSPSDDEVIAEQTRKIEYLLTQQDMAKKAEIYAKRQALRNTVSNVNSQLQSKFIEQEAGEVSAAKKGDLKSLEAIREQKDQLTDKQMQLQKAAAEFTVKLDRAEMIERVRTMAAQKNIERGVEKMQTELQTSGQ